MIKRTSLSLLAIFCYAPSEAQEIPATMTVGSVKVKIDADARILISKEITALSTNKKYVEAMLRRMTLYFPIIEQELKEEGIPDELKYLCALESGLFPDQISTSNAVGFWQFKAATAIEAGLHIDASIDERRHIRASTRAMAIYLKRSNIILHNWVSSLLSYRSGLSAVRKMSHIDWAYKKEINVIGSTDAYIIRFLAYRHYLEREFLKIKNEPVSSYLLEYTNTRGKSISNIATELGVNPSEIIVNNTWLKSTTIPDDKDYAVYLTADVDRYVELKAIIDRQKYSSSLPGKPNQDLGFPVLVRITQEPNNESEPIYYEINGIKGILAISGDTPESIANRAGINVHKFIRYNDISLSERITAGEVYYLKKKKTRAEIAYHTVQGNETLWRISQLYGIQLSELLDKNRLTQIQRLQKGRLLYLREYRPEMQAIEYVQIPEEPVSTTASPLDRVSDVPKEDPSAKAGAISEIRQTYISPTPKSNEQSDVQQIHTVKPKDTFYSIARIYGMKVSDLYAKNNISASSTLSVGQTLLVGNSPKSGAITAGTTNNDDVMVVLSTNTGPILKHEEEIKSDDLKNETGSSTTHIVAPKQNLYRISLMYHVSVADIKKWNRLEDDNIIKGQSLSIYSNNALSGNKVSLVEGIEATNSHHIVKTGETVYRIADTYNMRVEEVVRLNNIRGFNIRTGQRLLVKK